MAPPYAIPRLLQRNSLTYADIHLGNPRSLRCASPCPHQGAGKPGIRPQQGRRHRLLRRLSARTAEPKRRQRRARSSLWRNGRAHPEPGRQAVVDDALGATRHRQHLRRRRPGHGGLAAGRMSRAPSSSGPSPDREVHHGDATGRVVRHVSRDRLPFLRSERAHQCGLAFEIRFEDAEMAPCQAPAAWRRTNSSPTSPAFSRRAAHASQRSIS